MLFKRIYNWIKYKTLPSSFLFKNRLFIERDSKHRRILSNFGLSFRNSKWSNYENYNIKNKFRQTYIKYFIYSFYLFLFIFILYYFKKYYILSFFFNHISFIFWISIDTFDYYLSFFLWLFTISISLFFNFIYSYFFFNNFSNIKSNNNIFSNNSYKFLNLNTNTNPKDNYISKHDLNWILYSWLTNNKSKYNEQIIEHVFENEFNKNWWNNNYDFFIKLYKLVFLLNSNSEKNNSHFLKFNINLINNKNFKGDYSSLINSFNNTTLLNSNSSFIMSFLLNNYSNYFDLKNKSNNSLQLLNSRYEWNIYNFNNEIEYYSFLLKNKNGFFFLNDFNYQSFSYFISNFSELWVLNDFIKNQLNAAKWNRWLYRYSILHRKILKNSHKITLSKKLINSGFYDSKIFDKNIWATEHLNKINNIEIFSSIFRTYYNSIFDYTGTPFLNHKIYLNNNFNQKSSFNFLNLYENSYFWYLKRFYLFNTLNNNTIKSNINYKQNNLISSHPDNINIFNKYSVSLNYLLKSTFINLNNFSHVNNHYFNKDFNELLSLKNSEKFNFFSNFKDVFLLNNEIYLLSKDNLKLFYWITSTSGFKNNFFFFNYLSNNLITLNTNSKFFINNYNYNFSYWLAYSLINTDDLFLKDFCYLTLFY